MPKYKVFDHKNPDRLLGNLTDKRSIHYAPYFSLAVAPRMTARYVSYDYSERPDVIYRVADFRFDVRSTSTQETPTLRVIREETVLLTDTPLETLMQLEKFMLPEETTGEHHVRHKYRDVY